MPRTYTMTAAQVIAQARLLIADRREDTGLRTSDADLLTCLNEALAAMVGIIPGLFGVHQAYSCTAGYLQSFEAERASSVIEVLGLPEADPAALTQFKPGWTADAQAAPENWMRVAGDPLRFMVYPPATAGTSLVVRYARALAALSSTSQVIEVPETYMPALVEYVAGRSELQDDEHVNSGRAAALLERFAASVRGG